MTQSAEPQAPMTVAEFQAWTAGRGDDTRYELHDGVVVRMQAESYRHARAKRRITLALIAAVERAGADCEVLLDGMRLQVDAHNAFEPDVSVECGARGSEDESLLAAPMLVVEVVSPSSRGHDFSHKLQGYLSVPSIQHYLIVDPQRDSLVHYRRTSTQGDQGRLGAAIQILSSGPLSLDPPGLTLDVAEILEGAGSVAGARSV